MQSILQEAFHPEPLQTSHNFPEGKSTYELRCRPEIYLVRILPILTGFSSKGWELAEIVAVLLYDAELHPLGVILPNLILFEDSSSIFLLHLLRILQTNSYDS